MAAILRRKFRESSGPLGQISGSTTGKLHENLSHISAVGVQNTFCSVHIRHGKEIMNGRIPTNLSSKIFT